MKSFLAISLLVNVAVLALWLQSRHGLSKQPDAVAKIAPAALASVVDVRVDEQAIAERVAARLSAESASSLRSAPTPALMPAPSAVAPGEPALAPEPAPRTPEQLEAAASGQLKLDQVVMKGHFQPQDTTELRQLSRRMAAEDQLQLRRQLVVAINSGKLDIPDPELIP